MRLSLACTHAIESLSRTEYLSSASYVTESYKVTVSRSALADNAYKVVLSYNRFTIGEVVYMHDKDDSRYKTLEMARNMIDEMIADY